MVSAGGARGARRRPRLLPPVPGRRGFLAAALPGALGWRRRPLHRRLPARRLWRATPARACAPFSCPCRVGSPPPPAAASPIVAPVWTAITCRPALRHAMLLDSVRQAQTQLRHGCTSCAGNSGDLQNSWARRVTPRMQSRDAASGCCRQSRWRSAWTCGRRSWRRC